MSTAYSVFPDFQWQSEDQRKGFLNLVQFLNNYGVAMPTGLTALVAAYFIQKDHESNEWWRDVVSNQVSGLQSDIALLRDMVAKQAGDISVLQHQVRSMVGTLAQGEPCSEKSTSS